MTTPQPPLDVRHALAQIITLATARASSANPDIVRGEQAQALHAIAERAVRASRTLDSAESAGPSVSGQPTPTTDDLDEARAEIDELGEQYRACVLAFAGALDVDVPDDLPLDMVWPRVVPAVREEHGLLADLFAGMRERGYEPAQDPVSDALGALDAARQARDEARSQLAEAREERDRLVAEVEKVRAACVREGRRAVAASSPITAAAWESRALELRRALAATAPAGWRPAKPGETPGAVEPDDARPEPIDATAPPEAPASRLSATHSQDPGPVDATAAEADVAQGSAQRPDGASVPITGYCNECGKEQRMDERINYCPDCGRFFCFGGECFTEHRALGTCPDHADGVLPAEPDDDNPPPVGEGGALIAATEAEIADMCDEWIGVNRLASQRDAWAETARILARALDGRPATPVQPEERRDGMDDADFDYAMTPERHAERIRGMGDTYRASSWWSFAEATHAQLMRVLGERDEWAGRAQLAEVDLRMARAALATAERERDEARRAANHNATVVNRLGAELFSLRSEVRKVAADIDAAVLPFGVGYVTGTYMQREAAVFVKRLRRAALGSTPDTGSTP